MASIFANRPSAFNADDWFSTLQSTIIHSDTTRYRSRYKIEHGIKAIQGVQLIAQTSALVANQYTMVDSDRQRVILIDNVRTHRNSYIDWCNHLRKAYHKEKCYLSSNGGNSNHRPEEMHMLSVAYAPAGRILLNRIYVALGGEDSYAVELETQKISVQLFELYDNIPDTMEWTSLRFVLLPFARAILNTTDEWLEYISHNTGKLAEPETYCRWLSAMGINLPDINKPVA